MKLHILFGQRKQRYDGEHAPEPLLCWSEYEVDENPGGFEEACDRIRREKESEFSAFRLILVGVDGDRIERLLNQPPTVQGTVDE